LILHLIQLHTVILIVPKILSMTCDNTSNNDAMINDLMRRVAIFGGEASHMHCFLHVVNLVAKSMICQFDVKKKDADAALAASEREHERKKLVEDWGSDDSDDDKVDGELNGMENKGDDGDTTDDDNGWIDKVELLTEREREALKKAIQPLKLVLVKVDNL